METDWRNELDRLDQASRDSVPEHLKEYPDPVGRLQLYISELEEALRSNRVPIPGDE